VEPSEKRGRQTRYTRTVYSERLGEPRRRRYASHRSGTFFENPDATDHAIRNKTQHGDVLLSEFFSLKHTPRYGVRFDS
jgi:hypothetical protein